MKKIVVLLLTFVLIIMPSSAFAACDNIEKLPKQLTHNHEHLNTEDICDNCGWQVLVKKDDKKVVYMVKEGHVSAEYYGESVDKNDYELTNPLVSVYISDNVKSIGDNAFFNNTYLKNIRLGNNLQSIGRSAFQGVNLKCITIPDSVTSIERGAFEDCRNITGVTIGNGVKSIGGGAFDRCNALENIYYAGDINGWLDIEFEGASANPLFQILEYNETKNLYINNELLTELIIPDNIKEIKANAFYGCSSLKSVVTPSGVNKIGENAFKNSKLKKATFQNTSGWYSEHTYYYALRNVSEKKITKYASNDLSDKKTAAEFLRREGERWERD